MDIKHYIPYTYLLGWSKLDKWYYGSRTAKKARCLYETGCHPDELLKTYYTSSKKVAELIKQHGKPDVVQIRKTFPDAPRKAQIWEGRVLKKLKVGSNPRWINEGYLSKVPNSWANKTPEQRKQHGRNIAYSQIQKGNHNFLKQNRKKKMGNEFDSESAKANALKRMKNGTNPFCKLCCVDRDGNIVWTERSVFFAQKDTGDLVMNSSKEGKKRLNYKGN
jgi:hypothetical protein